MPEGQGYTRLRQGVLTATAGTGELSAPASGATQELWASNSNVNSPHGGSRWKRIMVNIFSSHASAANGLQFDESSDNVTWRNVVSYTVAATTYTRNYVAVASSYVRVRYVNSANTLTTWQMEVLGDTEERGNV